MRVANVARKLAASHRSCLGFGVWGLRFRVSGFSGHMGECSQGCGLISYSFVQGACVMHDAGDAAVIGE